MNAVMTIAGREVRRAVRNRWIVAVTLLLMTLSLALAFLGSAATGTIGAARLDVTVVSLASLTVFLLPLIALMLSFDAIVGEVEGGTLLLLLTYPVSRWQVLAGKFLGHVAVIALATVIGFGATGATVIAISDGEGGSGFGAFIGMTLSSIALGSAFLSIGYLLSAWVRERGTAAGLAVAAWLLFVLLFDMALLGVLVADGGRGIDAGAVNLVMMLNPTDVYRLFNLAGTEGTAVLSGMAGLDTVAPSPALLAAALGAWIAVPLCAAIFIFNKREL